VSDNNGEGEADNVCVPEGEREGTSTKHVPRANLANVDIRRTNPA
jgi:hypothetical protein